MRVSHTIQKGWVGLRPHQVNLMIAWPLTGLLSERKPGFGPLGVPHRATSTPVPRHNSAARDRMPQAQMSSLPPNKGNNSGQTDTVSVELYKKEQGGPSRPHSQQPHFQSGVGHRMTICATESSQVNLYSGHILPASSRHGNKLQLCVF